MLLNSHPPKSNRSVEAVNKSSTAIVLPGISKPMKHPQTERKSSKLSYAQTIQGIFERMESGSKTLSLAGNEQSKLKQVLKKMNSDTHHIIETAKPKNNMVRIASQEFALIDRQIQNSKKSIVMMQGEMATLQDKFKKIVYPQHLQEVNNKIEEIIKQIDEIRTNNIEMKSSLERNSFRIVKQQNEGQDIRLEYLESEKAVLDKKLQKLKNDNNRTVEETAKIQSRIKQVEAKFLEKEEQYKSIKSSCLSEVANRNRQVGYTERKGQMEYIRKKMESHNNNLQYKYSKLSKDLQLRKTACTQLQMREIEVMTRISKGKEQMQSLQAEMGKARVRQGLASQLVDRAQL